MDDDVAAGMRDRFPALATGSSRPAIIATAPLDAMGEKTIRWTADHLALLAAGREPTSEPGPGSAWQSGPLAVRAWIARAVRLPRERGGQS